MAMYERALLHASSAINQVDEDLKTRLSTLVNTIESSKYCAHAQSVLEQDNEEELDSLKNDAKLQKVLFFVFINIFSRTVLMKYLFKYIFSFL